MLPPCNIILFDQVSALAAIESCHNVQGLVVKGNGRVEVSSRVQTRNLSPSVAADIINFAFVHGLAWQWASNSEDTRARPPWKYRCQSMGTPLKYHISTLLKPFVYELVATLGCFAWLTSACQKDSTFLIFDGHKVSWYLDIDDIWAVRVRAEVVHEQIVRVVDKEVQSVDHFAIVTDQWHLDGLLNHLRDG